MHSSEGAPLDYMAAELAKKIIEDFFIFWGNGILLYFGSNYIARKMETYKANESIRVVFTGEIAKEMDKVSKLLFQYEYAIEIMAKELEELEGKRRTEDAPDEETSHTAWIALFLKHAKILDTEKENALTAIEGSRFWLGKQYYSTAISHLDLLAEYEGLMEVKKFSEGKILWKKIDASRLYATDFLAKL